MQSLQLVPAFLVSFLIFFPLPQAFSQCNDTEVTISSTTGNYGDEMSWELYNDVGELIETFQGVNNDELTEQVICVPDGCFVLKGLDSYGDGWNGGVVEMTWDNGSGSFSFSTGFEHDFDFGINMTGCVPIVLGCTNANAFNYDPFATVDDGSCQTLSDVVAAQIFDTLCYSGPKDNRINWVIQNRGANNTFVDAADLSNELTQNLMPSFMLGDPGAKTPYAQYKDFFNIYAAWWPNAPSDDTWWGFNVIQPLRDEIFLPWANNETGWVTWFSTTKYGGGGGAGLNREARVGDGKMFGTNYDTQLHEFGHTMPGLLDEYTSSGVWSNNQCFETGNTTGYTIKDSIPWRNWIEDDTPLPTPYDGNYENVVAAFEGGLTNYFGCHRPTAKGCYMGAGGFGEGYGDDLCAPCVQRVICYLYRYVNVIENPTPASSNLTVTGTETISFSADVISPEPNTQKYEWFLNGKLVGEDVTSVELTFGSCDNYELKFAVTDTTNLVRYDEKFDDIYPKPYREFVWNIDQQDILEYDLSSALNITPANCTGENNGEVEFVIDGGLAPYEMWLEGSMVNNPAINLPPGSHEFTTVDASGCSVSETIEISQDDLLDLEICAINNGSWEVAVYAENYDPNTLDLSWSTGATDPVITGLSDGNYSLTATINGCSVTEDFELISSSDVLSVSDQFFPSEIDEPSGSIYVDVSDGSPAYEIKWYDKPAADRTDDNVDNISASGMNFGHLPEMGFDDDLGTKWLHAVSNDAWLAYEFEELTTVVYYAITSANDVPARDPNDWTFEGSNDGDSWTVLDTQTAEYFSARFQRRAFLLSDPAAFTHYRLNVSSSAGANEIQLQELEFIGTDPSAPFVHNPEFDNHFSRINLPPGEYRYEISDGSSACVDAEISIVGHEGFVADDLKVVQNGNCGVTIEVPNSDYNYYWLSDEEGAQILSAGVSFEPPYAGNFYVTASNSVTDGWGSNTKGFAVTMPLSPQIEDLGNGILTIIDPKPDEIYYWYDTDACGTPVHTGNTFEPGIAAAEYFISAKSSITYPDPIDPVNVSGLILRMDASDLNGDGQIDDPAPETSSILDWYFPTGNNWDPNNWFAYRSNYQNGLGIADWATLWLQRLEEAQNGYQSVIMAYQENELSWEKTGPFEGLSVHMPSHSDASQIYSNEAPTTTLNGRTFLNGQEVDPLTTNNPMNFCVLGSTFTEPASNDIFYTDVHWEGKVGELLFYEEELSVEEMQGVSEYLRQKWISTAELESPRTPFQWGTPVDTKQINNEASLISLSPNPATNTIFLQSSTTEPFNIAIFDLQGRLLLERISITLETNINLSEFSSGMYQLIINDGNSKVQVLRFVKI